MMKLHTAVIGLLMVSVAGVQGVQAEEEPAIRAVPLELFSCAWEDGKGMKDLMKASERFNKWADKHDMKYSAWTITPQFRSPE